MMLGSEWWWPGSYRDMTLIDSVLTVPLPSTCGWLEFGKRDLSAELPPLLLKQRHRDGILSIPVFPVIIFVMETDSLRLLMKNSYVIFDSRFVHLFLSIALVKFRN